MAFSPTSFSSGSRHSRAPRKSTPIGAFNPSIFIFLPTSRKARGISSKVCFSTTRRKGFRSKTPSPTRGSRRTREVEFRSPLDLLGKLLRRRRARPLVRVARLDRVILGLPRLDRDGSFLYFFRRSKQSRSRKHFLSPITFILTVLNNSQKRRLPEERREASVESQRPTHPRSPLRKR